MDEQTQTDTMLDDALDSYPMAELPPNFIYRVMADVQNQPQISEPEKFRLDYLDFLIPGFLVFFFVMITAVLSSWSNLDIDFAIVGQFVGLNVSGTAVLLVALFFEMCLGVIAYFYLWSERY